MVTPCHLLGANFLSTTLCKSYPQRRAFLRGKFGDSGVPASEGSIAILPSPYLSSFLFSFPNKGLSCSSSLRGPVVPRARRPPMSWISLIDGAWTRGSSILHLFSCFFPSPPAWSLFVTLLCFGPSPQPLAERRPGNCMPAGVSAPLDLLRDPSLLNSSSPSG